MRVIVFRIFFIIMIYMLVGGNFWRELVFYSLIFYFRLKFIFSFFGFYGIEVFRFRFGFFYRIMIIVL